MVINFLKKSAFPFNVLIISVVIVIFSFPDVVFFGRSISAIDNAPLAHTPYPPNPIIAEAPHRTQLHGYTDTAGAVWQSEPMIQFMRRSIMNGQSIFWNPFSATGSLGPETLVDQKLSPLTLINAITGGSNLSFHLTSLLLMIIAEFFLILSLQRFFNLTNIASAGAGIAFLLNGFQIANLSSNVSQVYFYLPILLFTTLLISTKPDYKNFIFLTLSQIPIFLTTFFPVTLMGLLGIYTISTIYLFSNNYVNNLKNKLKYTTGIFLLWALSTIFCLLVLAPLYMQIFDAYEATNDLSNYSNRVFVNATLFNLIALFSPKTIFESYGAIDPKLWDVNSTPYIGNVVFHFGIAGMLLLASTFSFGNKGSKLLNHLSIGILALVFISLSRIFGAPGINEIFNNIPIIRNIGEQYWWVFLAILISIGIGIGIEKYKRKETQIPSIAAIVILIVALYTNAIMQYKPLAHLELYALFCILFEALILASTIGILIMPRFKDNVNMKLLSIFLVLLLFGEYFFYINNFRANRSEYAKNPSPEIVFLQKNIGLNRTANYGWEGLPPEWGSMHGIQQIESINMNAIGNYQRFFERNFLKDPSTRWGNFLTLHNAKDNDDFNFDALNLLGVKYILVPREILPNRLKSLDPLKYPRVYDSPKITIVENLSALPRGYLVPALIKSNEAPYERGCKSRNTAFTTDDIFYDLAVKEQIKTSQTVDSSLCSDNNKPYLINESAIITKFENGKIEAEINSQSSAIFVLSNAWHRDWRASVNGNPTYIGIVNDAFQGIIVPEGKSKVIIEYKPRLMPLAILITFLTTILLFVSFFFRKKLNLLMSRFLKLH